MESFCAPLAFIDGLGTPEMMLIFVLILLLFGGQKLPEFARGIGKSLREFKKAASGVEEEFKRALEEDERKQHQPKLADSPAPPAPADAAAGPDAYLDNYTDYTSEHDYHDQPPPAEPAATPPATTPDAAGPGLPPAAPPPPADATPPAPPPAGEPPKQP